MALAYTYNPALHRIHDTPVSRFLRRELRRDDIVTYYHEGTKKWVISLYDGRKLLDLTLMGTGEGEGPGVNRSVVEKVFRQLRRIIETVQVGKMIARWLNKQGEQQNVKHEQYVESCKYVAKWLSKRYGEIRGEKFLRETIPVSSKHKMVRI